MALSGDIFFALERWQNSFIVSRTSLATLREGRYDTNVFLPVVLDQFVIVAGDNVGLSDLLVSSKFFY